MQKLSTGADSTLHNWRDLIVAIFGEASNAVKFIDNKISKSPNGDADEVLVAETQLPFVLSTLHKAMYK